MKTGTGLKQEVLTFSPWVPRSIAFPMHGSINVPPFYLIFGHATLHTGSWFPDHRPNLCPLQWKLGALTTGPPGKSHKCSILLAACQSQLCGWLVIREHHTIETEAVENGISTASLSGFNMSGCTQCSVKGSHHTPCTPEELTFWDNGKGQRSSRWSRADGSCSDIHTHA